MTAVAAALAAMVTVAGMVTIVAWWRGVFVTQPRRSLSTGLWTRTVDNVSLGRADAVRLLAGAVGGVVLAFYSGLPLLAGVIPLAVWGLPRLLGEPARSEVRTLESLDRWVRAMAATMATGKSITDALRLSARQVPAQLQPHLHRVVQRLDQRWQPAQALAAMADDLDSPDADAILASLMLAVQRGGTGATATLSALADSIQDRLRALREIEAERAKPRIVVRQVTLVTLVMMSGALIVGRGYFAPYGTPLGQMLLGAILGLYAMSLIAMRRLTVPRRRPRILQADT